MKPRDSMALFVLVILSTTLTAAANNPRPRDYRLFIRMNAPSEDAFVVLQALAEPYIERRNWDRAIKIFERYRRLFPGQDARFENIIKLLEAQEEGLEIHNLGPYINTPATEVLPVLSADGSELYFTGKDRTDCMGGEDVFRSQFQNDGWGEAEPLFEINSAEKNESLTSVSFDGNLLLFFLGSFYEGEERTRGDIYYSEKTSRGWEEPQNFHWPINSIYFDSDAFVTSDGKAILFTSDRRGVVGNYHQAGVLYHGHSWGNTDIFVCLKDDTGWSQAINLGPVINTPYAERTPFLHPDGKTLYFSSDGHYGLGKLDVFKSVRLSEDSWTEWSEPLNLGKEINTARDDIGYKIATAGDIAFFSTVTQTTNAGKKAVPQSVEGYGGYDIYYITLPGQAKPEAVATIKGSVTDSYGNPVSAIIKWENLTTGQNAGQLSSDPRDGSYFIVLPLGKNYGYFAEKEGFYPVSKKIDLTETIQAVEVTEDIVLLAIEDIKISGQPVRINNIFFDFDDHELKSESYPELERLAEILKDNPDVKIEIAGHTDNVGDDDYNLKLSQNRAKSVVNYLISQGCSFVNLIPNGYGEKEPLESNDTEEGRAINRRVEFRFLK